MREVSIATGMDILPFIEGIAAKASSKLGVKASVYGVDNPTFGGEVTVAGLLGGQDFLRVLKGRPLGERLIIPAAALREDNVFLDDMTLAELETALGVPVMPSADAYELVDYMAGQKLKEKNG